MYENKNQKLISSKQFAGRIFRNVWLFLIVLCVSLFIGMLGYHFLGDLGWVDSFTEASMILSGMGPVADMKNDAVKLFAGFYAIFSGAVFIAGATLLISPFWHRELHRFHLADEDEEDNEEFSGKKSHRIKM